MKKLLLSIGVVLTSISLNAQVTNGGFETWAAGNPASWTWYSNLPANAIANPALGGTCTANGVATMPCTQGTTGAPEGTSYVKLTTVTRAGSNDPQADGVFGGTIIQTKATTAKPTSFSFKYKYAGANSDSAIVFIQGTKWNGTSATVVGQGYYIVNANASAWTTVTNEAINWGATAPDTLEIFISSSIGDVLSGGYTPQDNSIFEVDQLTMAGGTASIDEFTNSTVSVYPNPATSVLNIDSKEDVSSVNVITTDGKIVATSSTSSINLENLNAGMYIYQVTTVSGKISTGNFVKN